MHIIDGLYTNMQGMEWAQFEEPEGDGVIEEYYMGDGDIESSDDEE